MIVEIATAADAEEGAMNWSQSEEAVFVTQLLCQCGATLLITSNDIGSDGVVKGIVTHGCGFSGTVKFANWGA